MSGTEAKAELVIVNPLGLHARPASKFVAIANKFKSDVFIGNGETEVNGKSILGVMMLACRKGSSVFVRCVGDDSEPALTALSALINDGFGES